MTNIKYLFLIIFSTGLLYNCSNEPATEEISFYEVPLVCGAAPEIGCGSRIKPLFIDLEKEPTVAEAWTNREGTVLAIKWKNSSDSKAKVDLAERLFEKHGIKANYVSHGKSNDSLQKSLASNTENWLKGMAVDSLSHYEAGVIAHTLTDFAKEAKLISQEEQDKIRTEIEAYFKKELVMVRTENELRSDETQGRWYEDGFMIYQKHIGKERADAVGKFFKDHEIEIMKQESCCSEDEGCGDNNEVSEKSTITCPKCGHKKQETLPTDICLLKYQCENCREILYPKAGDCCVFCTYGDHKCPSMQEKI